MMAVLAFWSMANRVGERCLQAVVLISAKVRPVIHDDPGQVLASAGSHDAGLSVMDVESLFHGQDAGVEMKPLDPASEVLIAGKSQVVPERQARTSVRTLPA